MCDEAQKRPDKDIWRARARDAENKRAEMERAKILELILTPGEGDLNRSK